MNLILPEKRRLVAERFRTTDTAIAFRMGAGFPGDVNRGHPCSIQPCVIDLSAPPTAYGQAVLIDPTTQGVRPIVAGDQALVTIWGVTVRPYPIQQATTGNPYGEVFYGGSGGVPSAQPADVLRGGYIFVNVNTLNGSPIKGGPVFIWAAASGGGHTQGGFEGATGGGINTMALDTTEYMWNSPADSTGVAELILNKM
jgi:hypothetical protein